MTQNKTIHLCIAHMSETGEEMKYINRAFDEHWVAPLGPNVDGFEEDSDYLVMHLYTYGKSQLNGWLFLFLGVGASDVR